MSPSGLGVGRGLGLVSVVGTGASGGVDDRGGGGREGGEGERLNTVIEGLNANPLSSDASPLAAVTATTRGQGSGRDGHDNQEDEDNAGMDEALEFFMDAFTEGG